MPLTASLSLLPSRIDSIYAASELPSTECRDVPVGVPPPGYIDKSRGIALRAITAAGNMRYEHHRNTIIQPAHYLITKLAHSILPSEKQEPVYLATGWKRYLHPEGPPFYVNDAFKVVTDIAISQPALYDRVTAAVAHCQEAIAREINISEQCELFLQLDSTGEQFNYYLVDHISQVQFWLEDIDPQAVGLPPVSSPGHLKYVLQDHYWNHVEYFPHRPIPEDSRKELIGILRHAQGDHLTSSSSTFPYDATECAQFIRLIDVGSDACDNVFLTCTIARLWSTVARHRFDNFYGEYFARMDRDRRLLDRPVIKRTMSIKLCSNLFLFGIPETFKRQLDVLLIDNLVYAMHWRKFATSLTKSWRECSFTLTGLLITSSVLLSGSNGVVSVYCGLASTTISLVGLGCALLLLHNYSHAADYTAAVAARHVRQLEHDQLGFELAAVLFSIPKALVFWSTIMLAVETCSIFVEGSGPEIALLLASMIGVSVVLLAASFAILQGAAYCRTRRQAREDADLSV